MSFPGQREIFRHAVLNVLDANGTRYGLQVPAIRVHLVQFGFPGAPEWDIKTEIQYLCDKGHATEVLKGISPENRAWRITAEGRDYLAGLSDA